jgi:hypothetical protein
VLHVATPEASAAAEQPLRAVPFAVKPTVPVGASPVTLAVKVTDWPSVDGFALEIRAVADAAWFTTWGNTALVLVW